MMKNLKLLLAAMLGFSTACSTVKNVPEKGEQPQSEGVATTDSVNPRRIIVMYGVIPPRPVERIKADSIRVDEPDPVLEKPIDDTPELPAKK